MLFRMIFNQRSQNSILAFKVFQLGLNLLIQFSQLRLQLAILLMNHRVESLDLLVNFSLDC